MPPEFEPMVLSKIFEFDVGERQALTTVAGTFPPRAEGPGALRRALSFVHDGVVRNRDPAGTCSEDPLTDRILAVKPRTVAPRPPAETVMALTSPRHDDRPGMPTSGSWSL